MQMYKHVQRLNVDEFIMQSTTQIETHGLYGKAAWS